MIKQKKGKLGSQALNHFKEDQGRLCEFGLSFKRDHAKEVWDQLKFKGEHAKEVWNQLESKRGHAIERNIYVWKIINLFIYA
ncbi:hypothetical protein [Aerococcus urinaeequi]|uniref:hypothetical protein n=1 Tax=Aerococcus urinaeequi TaxID=51665 RepID=UPI003D6A732E